MSPWLQEWGIWGLLFLIWAGPSSSLASHLGGPAHRGQTLAVQTGSIYLLPQATASSIHISLTICLLLVNGWAVTPALGLVKNTWIEASVCRNSLEFMLCPQGSVSEAQACSEVEHLCHITSWGNNLGDATLETCPSPKLQARELIRGSQ